MLGDQRLRDRGGRRRGDWHRGLGHQGHGAIGPGHRAGAVRHLQGLEGHQRLTGRGETPGGIPLQQPLQLGLQGGLRLQSHRPAPGEVDRVQQIGRRFASQQHQRHHPQGMEIHPGLGRLSPQQLGGGIARRSPVAADLAGASGRQPPRGQTPHQAEIEQHRQAVTVAPQQVVGAEIAVQQILAVQGRQHRQQLAQQQQHLAGAEDHLAFAPGLQQLAVGAAALPFAHQPELPLVLNHGPEAGHLGMKHALQPAPELPGPGLVRFGSQPPQSHRRLGRQLIAGLPELTLSQYNRRITRRRTQLALQPIARADQLARGRQGRAHQPPTSGRRWGWCRPRPASQSRS